MDKKLFEFLLNSPENESLDFKSDQYDFINADDMKKSELLKDILAFTNSWRRVDAYILIGVIDGKGKISSVKSINNHIDDASLQQFVNSKTNTPIKFSYIPYSYENKDVGIIKIPLQKRPVYLLRDFGKLNKEVVYIRRGSSTDKASIDEISRMGDITDSFMNRPEILVEFSDDGTHKRIGEHQEFISNNLSFQYETIPDFFDYSNDILRSNLTPSNKNFYRELFEFISISISKQPISFFLKNISDTTAFNLNIIIKIQKTGELKILSETELPSIPNQYLNFLAGDITKNINFPDVFNEPLIEDLGSFYKIKYEIGNLQPKAEFWINKLFYICSSKSNKHTIEITIFADNLPNPITANLSINFLINDLSINLESLIDAYNKSVND